MKILDPTPSMEEGVTKFSTKYWNIGMRDKITETPTFSISKMTNDKIAKNIETPLLRSDHSQSHKEQQVQSSSKQRKNRTKERRKKRKSAKERRK